MHTPLCKHAVGEPEAYAQQAHQRGLAGIIFTCHNPIPDGWSANVRMDIAQFDQYLAMVDRARQAWAGRVDVRVGLESDFVPGMEPWLEQLHQKAPLNYVLGSVHIQLPEYKARYWTGDVLAYQRLYFEHLAQAAETHLFDALAHPDLVKNLFPQQWDPSRIMDSIRRCLDRVAESETAMELNTSGLNKTVAETNPGRAILLEMRARDIPVVIGSDSHVPQRVAADFESSLDLLGEVGFTHVSFFLDRQRRQIPLAEARASLRPAGSSPS
jgi:histidinol-phosphatase (PHP family)